MTIDLILLSKKLKAYREELGYSIEEVNNGTGIEEKTLKSYESGHKCPSGDDILILTDFYKCEDYCFFISNQTKSSFEQIKTLFRKHGNDFSPKDRQAIQEFLYLASCEAYLEDILEKGKKIFNFNKTVKNHKINGIKAAKELRAFLGYYDDEIPKDVYSDFRKMGLHVFRRKLLNSNISGLCIKHPKAGKCILVNYNEDTYRQRFTAAHEVGHAIMDDFEDDVIVSFENKNKYVDNAEIKYREIGANNFAAHYLVPRKFLHKFFNGNEEWDVNLVRYWSRQLNINTQTLAISLSEENLIDYKTKNKIMGVKIEGKEDSELHQGLSRLSLERRRLLLEQGLSDYYARLCFDAYREDKISKARLSEMLLVNQEELCEIAEIYCERI